MKKPLKAKTPQGMRFSDCLTWPQAAQIATNRLSTPKVTGYRPKAQTRGAPPPRADALIASTLSPSAPAQPIAERGTSAARQERTAPRWRRRPRRGASRLSASPWGRRSRSARRAAAPARGAGSRRRLDQSNASTKPRTSDRTSQATSGLKSIMPTGGRIRRIGSNEPVGQHHDGRASTAGRARSRTTRRSPARRARS